MFSIKEFTPRAYQENIFRTTKERNTLVCLPTGTGKTKNAILLAVHRLNSFPNTKALILSPTKPLSNQICEECKSSTTIPASQITLLTGLVKPEERKKLFEHSLIIVATPQTIANDIKNNLISLNGTSLLVIDECHRSKQRFANTIVASHYMQQSHYPLILALTASPGASREKIQEICKNLHVEDVEIRTEQDEDVLPYMQKKEMEYIKIDLPVEIKEAAALITEVYQEKLRMLKSFGITKPTALINKRDMLLLQKRFQGELKRGNKRAFAALSLVAQVIKVNYLLELVETQSIKAAEKYITKLREETSKAAKVILNHAKIQALLAKIEKLKQTHHPKLLKTREIIAKMLQQDSKAKAIVFANYRSTVDELKELLSTVPGAKPTILVGQKLGFSQKEQLQIIDRFNNNVSNILIGTSITEEGLSIGSLDLAIFYDHTGSEIRKIQRSGRVGRIKPGKVIYLAAKGTRDEAMLWTSVRKERKMQDILRSMKQKIEKQQMLFPQK